MPSISPIEVSTSSMAANGRAGSGVTSPGATIGQTTSAKAKATPSRTRAGIACSPKPGSSAAMAPTRTKTRMKPASPASVISSSAASPSIRRAPARRGGRWRRSPSNDSTGLQLPVASSTVWRNRRRRVDVTSAG